MEGLAGKKEGCDDDVEFLQVQRPDNGSSASSTGFGQVRACGRLPASVCVWLVHGYGHGKLMVAELGPMKPFSSTSHPNLSSSQTRTPPRFHSFSPPQPHPQAFSSTSQLAKLASTALSLGHPGEVALKWVTVPLGSVRVSLGWMSTFEDVYSLVDFVAKRYKDRTA